MRICADRSGFFVQRVAHRSRGRKHYALTGAQVRRQKRPSPQKNTPQRACALTSPIDCGRPFYADFNCNPGALLTIASASNFVTSFPSLPYSLSSPNASMRSD